VKADLVDFASSMCPVPHDPLQDSAVLATAHALALDRVAADVTAALRAAGVEPVLLKGAAVAAWLYRDGAPRGYGDVDLLVAPADLERARGVLERLGLRGEDVVDLTDTLNGVGLHPAAAWPVLAAGLEPLAVGGTRVRVLGPDARALHVALHAWWHGAAEERPLADLARALAVVDDAGWRAAHALAVRLHATEGLAGGLDLLPEGRAVRARLGLAAPRSVGSVTPMATAGPVVRGLDSVRRAAGPRAKAAVLARILLPPGGEMRMRYPVARRGRRGLAAAHALRAGRRTAELPGELRRFARAWSRARRGG